MKREGPQNLQNITNVKQEVIATALLQNIQNITNAKPKVVERPKTFLQKLQKIIRPKTVLQKFQRIIKAKREVAPKKEHPSFGQNLKEYVREWSGNTSVHGVRYLGQRKRNIYEKLWWLIVFAISLYLCIDLILKTYQKWDSSPVIVSFAESPKPIWQIPFPAVTICPEIKARRSVYNFTQKAYEFYNKTARENQVEWKKFSDLSLVCDWEKSIIGELYGDNDTINLITEVSPEFDEIFFNCNWTDKNDSCDQLFTQILTDEGICYTFNMLKEEDIFRNDHNQQNPTHDKNEGWTLDEGYPKGAEKDTFPRRVLSAGTKAGLTLTLKANKFDVDYICAGPIQGFKILLHHPDQTPIVSSQYFRTPLDQETTVIVKPDMMTTSESLRHYAYHRRQCYFSTERALTFHKYYTQKNCEVECLAASTLEKCGCVPYYMPHNESTKICGSGRSKCMEEAMREQLFQEVQRGIRRSTSIPPQLDEDKCNCLPACTSLSYHAETSYAPFDWNKMFNARKINTSEFLDVKLSKVTIFFQDMQFITSERNELYGTTDFIANCGGLLGLFIGISFLSVVETIYFLTFRLFCNVRRHGKYFWSGSPDLINDASHHQK